GTSSDGLQQLDATHTLGTTHQDATNGNVVQVAQIDLGKKGKGEIALGFGASKSEAIGAAEGSLGRPVDRALQLYKKGLHDSDKGLNDPPHKLPGLRGNDIHDLQDTYYTSANVLKASEDKTFPGAIVASIASPWGQAISAGDPANTYFGSYREVF